MDEPAKCVGLFQDILALEKEYNYNVVQLKVKDDDLERYRLTNLSLQQTINVNLEEIKRLKAHVRNLEDAEAKTRREHDAEKGVCEAVIRKLTLKIGEMKEHQRSELDNAQREMQRRFDEVERMHARNCEEKDKGYVEKVTALQEDLQESMSTITRLNTQLQQLLDTNMDMQNKMRDTETKFIPELTVYKNEAALLKRTNAELTATVAALQGEHAKHGQNLSRLKTKNDHLETCLCERDAFIAKLSSENATLKTDLDKTLRENATAQQKASESAARECRCGELTRQNQILKEIVKSLKSERDANTHAELTHAKEFSEAERKVERVENLLCALKKSMIDNCTLEYSSN